MDASSIPFTLRHPNLGGLKLTNSQKLFLVDLVVDKGLRVTDVSGYFKISRTTLDTWVRHSKTGMMVHARKGRPSALDEISTANMLAHVNTGDGYHCTSTSFKEMFNKEKVATAKRYGIASCYTISAAKSTIQRFEHLHGIEDRNGETTTNARAVACQDLVNAVGFAALTQYMVNERGTHPALIVNADATQFKVGGNDDQSVKVKYPKEGKGVTTAFKTRDLVESEGLVSYFIKYLGLMSAVGVLASPVYIAADKNMEPEDLDVHWMPNLGVSTDVNAGAWMVFCRTRCANVKFYMWFNEVVLIPFIRDVRKANDLLVTDTAFFSLDGEPAQIKCYEDKGVLEMLEVANIVVGKPAGSTTEISQAFDCGNLFKAATKNCRV